MRLTQYSLIQRQRSWINFRPISVHVCSVLGFPCVPIVQMSTTEYLPGGYKVVFEDFHLVVMAIVVMSMMDVFFLESEAELALWGEGSRAKGWYSVWAQS